MPGRVLREPVLWLGILLVFISIFDLGVLAVRLENTDKSAYLLCKKIESSKLFTRKVTVAYYLTYSPLIKLYGGAAADVRENRIYFDTSALKNQYLDVTIAHELGHIESGKIGIHSQFDADLFALKVLGNGQRERFISAPRSWYRPESYIKSVLAVFDREGNR